MTKKKWYLDNLVWFSIALSLFSCGFDGAFLSALMWIKVPTLGAIFGQGLNFAADAATHVLGHQFADEQRKARKGSKRYALSFVLLAGDLAALFYSIAFSWLQIRTNAPDLEPWAQWVTASFAPVVIGLLGVARAFRDANNETKAATVAQVARKPMAQPKLAEPTPEQKAAQGQLQAATVEFIKGEIAQLPQLNERQTATLETLAANPDITFTQLAQVHGVSRPTATKDVRLLQAAGKVRRNGHGWEVQE